MIKIFSQYSYGGYKTFYIEGVQSEALNREKEVTLENTNDFPLTAQVYFQYGGSKIVYRRLQSGELALVIREIPSNDVDGAGRPISCAVQFIGKEQDRQTLDNLALSIANDFVAFESFFSDLFYVRNGLHIEGDKLRTFIDSFSGKTIVIGDTNPTLLSIGKKHDGVFLFVPLSEKFGKDNDVTSRVCKELKFELNELKDAVINLKELSRIQKKINIIFQPKEEVPKLDEKIDNNEQIAKLEEENKRLQDKIKQQDKNNFENLKRMQDDVIKKSNENKTLSKELRFYKKLSIGLGIASVLFALSLIGTCSNEKKNVNTDNTTEQTAIRHFNNIEHKTT